MKIFKDKGILIISLILLTGCNQRLASQAVKDAEIAIEEQLYNQASLLLHLAKVESSNSEYDALYEQSLHLIKMKEYKEANNLDQILLAWTELNLIPSRSDTIKDEAVRLINQFLKEVEDEAKELLVMGNPKEIIDFIRLIENRMGTFEVFQPEIERLIELRNQLEGAQV